jgi:hypothetical protein
VLASIVLHALAATAVLAPAVRSIETRAANPSAAPVAFDVSFEIAPEAASEANPEADARSAPPAESIHPRSRQPAPQSPPEGTSHGGAPEEWSFRPGGPPPADSARTGDGLASAVRRGVAATVREELREAAARDAHRTVPEYGERDLSLGLTPGGELVALSEDAVRRSLVPDVGYADLRFDADERGVVVAADVVNASSAWAEWQRAAHEVVTSAPTLRMPREAHGLAIVVRVESYLCRPPYCAILTRLARTRITSAQVF